MKHPNLLLYLVRATNLTTLLYKPRPRLPFHSFTRGCSSSYGRDDIYLRNRKINELLKTGHFDYAQKLFDEMPVRDVITWNIMISGYNGYGLSKECLSLYNKMVWQGVVENSSTFSSILSVCSNGGLYSVGVLVHCRAIVLGLSMNLYIGSALVDLYMQMGQFDVALRLFSSLPERNLATWNVVLRGACESGSFEELFRLYNGMIKDGVEPNGLSFCYLIRGCGSGRFLDEGIQLHSCVIKKGLIKANHFVANALVDFYSACGSFAGAKSVFQVIPPQNIISWNSMVSVSAASGDVLHALEIFNRMQFWDMRPAAASFLGLLKVSSGRKNILLGQEIHACVLKLGFGSGLVYSALIDMYGKCGDVGSSFRVFGSVPERSLGCCNSLMTSLLRSDLKEDVVELFGMMVDEQIGYDEVSLSSTLKALSTSTFACSASCMLLHCCTIKSGFETDNAVACSLIDAYSRSGEVEISSEVFNHIPFPNAICFTSVITAFARNGCGKKCLRMLEKMIHYGLKPDKVTFLNVLMGCNHSGLVEEGRLVFQSMITQHGLRPEREHYSCMVDLLGRAGLLEEAEQLLNNSPLQGDSVIWSSILRSCGTYEHSQLGKKTAETLVNNDPENPASWLQARKFYSDIGYFGSSEQIHENLVERKMSWGKGQSLIEVRN